MFRKKQDVAERSRSLLKNSAAKKIKTEILAALPTLSKDVIDELMPNKVSVIPGARYNNNGSVQEYMVVVCFSVG